MDSNATTVLVQGIGPQGSPSLIITLGFATSGIEPSGGGGALILMGVG